eukprot:2829284-Rhodomonas_salina.2
MSKSGMPHTLSRARIGYTCMPHTPSHARIGYNCVRHTLSHGMMCRGAAFKDNFQPALVHPAIPVVCKGRTSCLTAPRD